MAGSIVTITEDLLQQLYHRTVLLKLNSGPPQDGRYGWLSVDQRVRLHHRVRMEQNSGLYAANYRPMLGGRSSSGLCTIGAFSYSYSALPDELEVGRYCSISRGLSFIDSFHPTDRITSSALLFRPNNKLYAPTLTDAVRDYSQNFSVIGDDPYPTIGNDVWIGGDVTLAKGIRIGHGAIIAANSTVTRNVPAYAVVAGNPARVVRMRFGDEMIGRLLATQWWNYDPAGIFETTDPELSMSWIESGKIDRYAFESVTIDPAADD